MENGAKIEASNERRHGWPDEFKVSIWLLNEDNQWSALASDFNVAGMGASQEAALENLRENVTAYLHSYMAEGASLKDARRRISYRESLRLTFFALVTRFSRAVTSSERRHQVSYDGPRAVEHSQMALR